MPADLTTIATSLFQFTTPASPDQVWGALTRPEATARYLFGMTVESDWRTGSPVVVQPPSGSGIDDVLAGEVLSVVEGRRLSFTLSSGPAHPTTFVTWEIEPAEGGSAVRLYVDESSRAADGAGDTEAAWLQAVTALRGALTRLLR